MGLEREAKLCEKGCIEPKGYSMVEVPASRHDWDDILRCPNIGCERTFLVLERRPVVKRIVVEGPE